MKFSKLLFVGAFFSTMLAMLTVIVAQTNNQPMDRAQMKKDIEIVEGVLNTVRQQSLTAVFSSVQEREVDRNAPSVMYFRVSDGRRSEGFYLNGYGVIFEVYLPNFKEQRTFNILARKPGVATVRTERPAPEPLSIPSTAARPATVDVNVETSATALHALSKLMETYTREMQSQGKETALKQLLSKLRDSDLLPQMKVMTTSFFNDLNLSEKSPSEESRIVAQKKEFQDSILKAVASYGSAISQLQPGEFVTILFKTPMTQDFSLFSPETRTSQIIRFSVKDLHDYKVGKLSYAELLGKISIEEN